MRSKSPNPLSVSPFNGGGAHAGGGRAALGTTTVRKDGRGRLYLVKAQENGHFKESNTWKLDDLSAVDLDPDGQVRESCPWPRPCPALAPCPTLALPLSRP